MKRLVSLLLSGAALVCTAAPTMAQLPPLIGAQGQASSAWRFIGLPKNQGNIPPTIFQAGKVDGQAGLQVTTQASYGTWVHPWHAPLPGRLTWRWRLDEPLTGGQRAPDLLTKTGDDAALKVCVMLDHPLDRVPFVERTLLRMARSTSGEDLPAATVCYVWDSAGPAPRDGVNPYTRRVRFVSLRGRGAPLGQWVTESRDVAQDVARLFAEELPQGAQTPRADLPLVTHVLIGADSDNTAGHSVGWVAELQVGPPKP